MSEFLAEATVLIRPDTTKFRATLQAELAAATRGITVPVTVVPSATGAGLSALTAETAAASTATRSLALEQKAGIDVSKESARQAASHAKTLGAVEKAAFASAASMTGLRGAVLTAGTAFLGATVAFVAFSKAVSSAAALETELNVFRVTAQATAEEMERVSQTAQELGRDITLPGVAASDAAVALTSLARAGLSVEDSLGGARGVLQLATAAQIDNAAAAELVANSLNAFSLSGEDAVRVADLLTGASNEAQGSIGDMGLALKQAAAVASLAGLSIEDTVVLLTELARAGLSSSDAGTSLRTTLLRLVGDFPKVKEQIAALGITLRDAEGNLRPEIFDEIGVALEKLGPAARQQALAILGGSDAIRAFGILSRGSAADTALLTDAVTEQGLAVEAAGARTSGFSGDVENLKNQMSALGIVVGQLAIPPLSLMAQTLAEVARAANDTISSMRSLIQEVAGLGKPFADAIPFIDQAEGRLGDIVKTGAKLQLLGPVVTIASLALDRFGDSADEAADDVDKLSFALTIFDREMRRTTESLQGLGAVGGNQAEGLNVQQILNRVTGFDSAEVRARIDGDTAEIVAVLRDAQAFLEQQLQREFVKRRPALQRQLENALFGVTNDLAAIASSGAADAKRAADTAARAIQDADRALLDALSQRRDDFQRRITTAGDTEGVRDDIKRHNQFQALIKIQIAKIRERIKDEQARKEAIRQLRIALIASRAEEEKLRQQQAQEAAAAKQESINLDISFAEITGNVAREIAARQRLIALLKKQQASVKKGTAEWKRLRNEIAEQQAAIKDAKGEAEKNKESGKTAQQFFFEQLQAQQGFAANLLGNVIPAGMTAGLVGVPSDNLPGSGVQTAAQLAEGKSDRGPTSGQASTTNEILRRILQQLRALNRVADSPEAIYQAKVGSGTMTGGGGNAEVL